MLTAWLNEERLEHARTFYFSLSLRPVREREKSLMLTMDKHELTGLNLGQVFNSRKGCMWRNTLIVQYNKTA